MGGSTPTARNLAAAVRSESRTGKRAASSDCTKCWTKACPIMIPESLVCGRWVPLSARQAKARQGGMQMVGPHHKYISPWQGLSILGTRFEHRPVLLRERELAAASASTAQPALPRGERQWEMQSSCMFCWCLARLV